MSKMGKDPGWASGNFTPDHQPPISLNKGVVGDQWLYPHCKACTSVQGGQAASTKSALGF